MITSFYAALLAILFLVLSARTIRARRQFKVGIGDNDNPEMKRAMRVHANFAEYTPLSLVLIYFVEVQTGLGWLVHLLGITLVAGRGLHAWGVSQSKEDFRFRVNGMLATFAVLAFSALILLVTPLFN